MAWENTFLSHSGKKEEKKGLITVATKATVHLLAKLSDREEVNEWMLN